MLQLLIVKNNSYCENDNIIQNINYQDMKGIIGVGTGGGARGGYSPPNLDLGGLTPQHVICNSVCIATSIHS